MCLAMDAFCHRPEGPMTSWKATAGLPKRVAEDFEQAFFADIDGPLPDELGNSSLRPKGKCPCRS